MMDTIKSPTDRGNCRQGYVFSYISLHIMNWLLLTITLFCNLYSIASAEELQIISAL